MNKLLLFLLIPIAAMAQTPARFDMPAVMTTPSEVPSGSLPNLLAVTNATITVCGFPATLSGGMCTNTITTYTDSTLTKACPPTAQLTAPGSSACIATTGLQGAFGFWYDASVQTHMVYTVRAKWGAFGPFDILQSGGGGGGGVIPAVQHQLGQYDTPGTNIKGSQVTTDDNGNLNVPLAATAKGVNNALDATRYGSTQSAITASCAGSPVSQVNITNQTPAGTFANPCNAPVEMHTPGRESLEFHIRDYGAFPDVLAISGNGTLTGFSTTAGSATVATSGTFTTADIGKVIAVMGAGQNVTYAIPTTTVGAPATASSAGSFVAKIVSITDSKHAVTNATATNTIAFRTGWYGTPQDAAINATYAACQAATLGSDGRRGVVIYDPGSYAMGGTIQRNACQEQGAPIEQSAIYYMGYNVTTNTQIPGGTQPVIQCGAGCQVSSGYMRDMTFNGDPGWALDGYDIEAQAVDNGYVLTNVHVTGVVRDSYHLGSGFLNLHWWNLRADGAGRAVFYTILPNSVGSFKIDGFTYDNSKQPQGYAGLASAGVSSTLMYIENENSTHDGDHSGFGGNISFENARIESNYSTLPGDALFQIHAYAAASVVINLKGISQHWFSTSTTFPNFVNFDFDTANTGPVNPYSVHFAMDNMNYATFANFSNTFTWQGNSFNYTTPPGWASVGLITHARLDGQSGLFCGSPFGSKMVLQGCNSYGVNSYATVNKVNDSLMLQHSDWNAGAGASIVDNAGSSGGGACQYTGTGVAVSQVICNSQPITVTPLNDYALSAYADTSNVVSGSVQWRVMDTALSTVYCSIVYNPASAGQRRSSPVCAIPSGVTQVVVALALSNATATNGQIVTGSDAQVQLGEFSTMYQPTSPAISTSLAASATLTYTSIAANTSQTQTMTVTGATNSMHSANCSPHAALGTNLSWSAWISAANTVSVIVSNPTVAAITPSAVQWGCTVNQ